MQAIEVIDLTGQAERRALWWARGTVPLHASAAAGLTHGGQPSPMGYWLACAPDPAALPPDALRIVLRAPSDGQPTSTDVASLARPGCRPVQSVRIKPVNAGDGDLLIAIGPGGAQVVATEAAWQALAEPIKLAICQYLRFCAVDAEIDRLTELAHRDLGPATMPGLAALRDRQRLCANALAARSLLLDLPQFEEPLTDPLPFVTSERSVQVYQNLVEKLHLDAWCEAIDIRADAIGDTYDAVAEKLSAYRNFVWEAMLETIIIVILLGDLALLAYELLWP